MDDGDEKSIFQAEYDENEDELAIKNLYNSLSSSIEDRTPHLESDSYSGSRNSLNGDWQLFRKKYYFHFKHSQTLHVRKEIIMEYHKKVSERYPDIIPKCSREAKRSVTCYFIAYASIGDIILEKIIELEKEKIINYEEDAKKYIKS